MLQVTDFGTIWNDFEQSFKRWKILILQCAIVNQDYYSNYTFVTMNFLSKWNFIRLFLYKKGMLKVQIKLSIYLC